MMKLKIWSYLASISLVSTIWFFYWAFVYEIAVLSKPVNQALSTNPYNMIMFLVSIFLLAFSRFWLRKTRFATINLGESLHGSDSGWLSKRMRKTKSFSFRPESIQESASRIGARRKIHVPGLRYMKRKIAWVVFIFDIFIVLFTLSNPAMLSVSLIFVLNGFYLLDYIWKTRKPTIIEQREAEKTQEKKR